MKGEKKGNSTKQIRNNHTCPQIQNVKVSFEMKTVHCNYSCKTLQLFCCKQDGHQDCNYTTMPLNLFFHKKRTSQANFHKSENTRIFLIRFHKKFLISNLRKTKSRMKKGFSHQFEIYLLILWFH